MFWKYTFCCLVAIYISNAVVFSKEKILQRGPSERLQYAIFKNDLFHSLDATRIEVGYVQTGKHCLVKCVKSLQCFSANIGVNLGKNGQVLCELLSSDKYSSAKSFHMNARGALAKHCMKLMTDYSCTCNKHYFGVNCEECKCFNIIKFGASWGKTKASSFNPRTYKLSNSHSTHGTTEGKL